MFLATDEAVTAERDRLWVQLIGAAIAVTAASWFVPLELLVFAFGVITPDRKRGSALDLLYAIDSDVCAIGPNSVTPHILLLRRDASIRIRRIGSKRITLKS